MSAVVGVCAIGAVLQFVAEHYFQGADVLDEFAADQDPAHRALYYDVLVPEMARRGHLVIAVTHDEHCFDKCDRLIRMEQGMIVSDTNVGGGARRVNAPSLT